jgi:ATP-dependent protease La (LON) substrate-binding domain
MATMPMFPLGGVLLPGVVLPLHVFEPRYRQLVTDSLESGDHQFGVVLIDRGSEVGGGDTRADVGVVAMMLQVAALDDGRFAVVTLGTRRIRVVQWLDDAPYPRAEVEDWPDEAGDDVSQGQLDATSSRARACAGLGCARDRPHRRPVVRHLSVGGDQPVGARRSVRRALRAEPTRTIAVAQSTARRRRGRVAVSTRLRVSKGRALGTRRATHMAVPDKDKPALQRDSGQIGQVVDLVKEYARQETLGPIKGAGRWLAVGAAGAVLIGTGCVFLVLGALRMIQTEFGKSFRNQWSALIPYLLALLISVLVMGAAAWRISKKKTLQKERR